MPIYRIAELNIQIHPLYPSTAARLKPYLTDSQGFELDASADTREIDAYIEKSEIPCTPPLAEGAIVLTKICRAVLEGFDGFFFHSSCLMLDGEGYLFTALSGTGKSTHTALWRKRFGDRVTMINDDKPIIRKIGGKFYVCGTPWMGKSEIGANLNAPIKAIYVLERGETNKAEHVTTGAVFRRLLEATLFPDSRENMEKLLELFDELFSSVQLIRLSCNMNPEAAQVAYDAANT